MLPHPRSTGHKKLYMTLGFRVDQSRARAITTMVGSLAAASQARAQQAATCKVRLRPGSQSRLSRPSGSRVQDSPPATSPGSRV